MKPTAEQLRELEALTQPPRCAASARKALRALLDDYKARGEALRRIAIDSHDDVTALYAKGVLE